MKVKELPELVKRLQSLTKGRKKKDVIFACVGTDRSTGDCLGPLVGHLLQQKGYNVVGTIDDPLHAMNLPDRIANEIEPTGKFVIAVDACLGQSSSIGLFQVLAEPIRPGAGVQKDLPPVGDIHIAGIVNVGGFMEYFVLQNTRFSLVYNMSHTIVEAIETTFKPKRSGKRHEKELIPI